MVELPLSGDVTQAFNPVQWWGQQTGFININTSRTDNPAMVASYGRQLGRIVDALDVLVSRLPATDQTAGERDALLAFSRMAREIAAVKGGPPALTLSQVDALIDDVCDLARTDPGLHREVVHRITAGLAGPPVPGRTASEPAAGPTTA